MSASPAVCVPVGDEASLAEPGLSVTLWAFSPHFHGYTIKSLKPGLVGVMSSAFLGLMGVVLMTDTKTRLGESLQKITRGCLLSAIVLGGSPTSGLKPRRSTTLLKNKDGGRYEWCASQSGVNMSFISKGEQEKKVVLLHQMVAEDVHS